MGRILSRGEILFYSGLGRPVARYVRRLKRHVVILSRMPAPARALLLVGA
jgi:hypothetical protein